MSRPNQIKGRQNIFKEINEHSHTTDKLLIYKIDENAGHYSEFLFGCIIGSVWLLHLELQLFRLSDPCLRNRSAENSCSFKDLCDFKDFLKLLCFDRGTVLHSGSIVGSWVGRNTDHNTNANNIDQLISTRHVFWCRACASINF